MLDAEQPHLVIFSGDQVSGYAHKDRSTGWFEARRALRVSFCCAQQVSLLYAAYAGVAAVAIILLRFCA